MIEFITMESGHWDEVRRIYEEGLATGNATFQTTAPEWEEWDKAHIQKSRLIAGISLTTCKATILVNLGC